nr:MerR family transcriptional regulator [Kibdelosporangium sp. MJ126-NF4]CEL19265.1 Transcriptional regulator, MerR family [Kibdelosporangium sp. MJ126-NF4]CTQ94936.1 Transcriptional regulator, MerR family [Kibdelosporangium sp. MJ126-NF4]
MWSIGETARKLGVAVSTLRYWDERGLVAPAARKSGHRFYGDDELRRLAVAKLLQDTGLLSIDEISAVVRGNLSGGDWRAAVESRLAAVHEQQQRLARAEAFLVHFLKCPNEEPVTECPYLHRDIKQILKNHDICDVDREIKAKEGSAPNGRVD